MVLEPAIIIAILLFCLGCVLLLHHGWVHSKDPATSHAKQESCACVCYFQLKDIDHCETWIILCLSNGISIIASTANPAIHSEPSKTVVIIAGVALVFLGLIMMCLVALTFELDVQHVKNHETWILFLWTNSAIIAVFNTILVNG